MLRDDATGCLVAHVARVQHVAFAMISGGFLQHEFGAVASPPRTDVAWKLRVLASSGHSLIAVDTFVASVIGGRPRDESPNAYAYGPRPGTVGAGLRPSAASAAVTAGSTVWHMANNDEDRYVVQNPNGGWDVVKENHKRASAHLDTQEAAIKRAQQIVENSGRGLGEVRIQGRDGKFRDSISGSRNETTAKDTR